MLENLKNPCGDECQGFRQLKNSLECGNINTCDDYAIYQAQCSILRDVVECNEDKLPKWAQHRLNKLRATINELESYRELHAILSDQDRDWFTITDPFKGCTDECLRLWLLFNDKPHPVCSLYKGDHLFVGRAYKNRYGERMVNKSNT